MNMAEPIPFSGLRGELRIGAPMARLATVITIGRPRPEAL